MLIGWAALALGDPARDLHWLLSARAAHAAERALDAYFGARAGDADAHLPQRALLYGELELATWLLHGVETARRRRSSPTPSGCSTASSRACTTLERAALPRDRPILAVGDIERMLDETPRENLPREAGASLLTDSYDFSDLERREAGERDTAPFDATAPIPLDPRTGATPLRATTRRRRGCRDRRPGPPQRRLVVDGARV